MFQSQAFDSSSASTVEALESYILDFFSLLAVYDLLKHFISIHLFQVFLVDVPFHASGRE